MLTRQKLERMARAGCSVEGCDHKNHGPLFLHGRCHLAGGLEASYTPGSGVLVIGCLVCHKTIATVAVAEDGTPAE